MRCAYFNTLKQWKKVPRELKRVVFCSIFAVFRHCSQFPWELHIIKKNLHAFSPTPPPSVPNNVLQDFIFGFLYFLFLLFSLQCSVVSPFVDLGSGVVSLALYLSVWSYSREVY